MIRKPAKPAAWQRATLSCCALVTWLAASAPGRTQEPELETITVTGSRVPRTDPSRDSVTVIDEDTIRARNDSNLFDLLRDLPGVHVSLPGGRGNLGSIFIRGAEPNYVAVLVDGIPVNDPTNTRGGSFDFSTLNVDSIERIEILKAPQSSIFGSDALSGVINVITRSGTEDATLGADVELGSADYLRAGLRLGAPAPGGGRYGLGLSGVNEGDAADPAEFESRSIHGKFSSATGGPLEYSVYARHASAEASAFPDDSGGERLAVFRERATRDIRDTSLGFDAGASLTEATMLRFSVSHFEHDERVFSPGVAPGVRNAIPRNTGDAQFTRSALNAFLTTRVSDSLQAAYGIGYQTEDGDGTSLITLGPQFELPTSYDLERDNVGVYGEIRYAASRQLSLDAAVRVDDNENASTVKTGSITLAYELPGRPTTFHVTWGEGFKLPSLFALGDPLVGNPGLRPETAESWELGVRSAHGEGRFRWQMAAFDQRYANLIDFDATSFMIVNRSRVDSSGLELSADFMASDHWLVSAHATRLDIDVMDSVVRLRQRPEKTGGLRLEWTPAGTWSAYLGLHYVGERFDSSVPTGGQTLPSHHRFDLTVNRALGAETAISIAVDNLTDESFEPAIGFPELGRRVRLGISGVFARRN